MNIVTVLVSSMLHVSMCQANFIYTQNHVGISSVWTRRPRSGTPDTSTILWIVRKRVPLAVGEGGPYIVVKGGLKYGCRYREYIAWCVHGVWLVYFPRDENTRMDNKRIVGEFMHDRISKIYCVSILLCIPQFTMRFLGGL